MRVKIGKRGIGLLDQRDAEKPSLRHADVVFVSLHRCYKPQDLGREARGIEEGDQTDKPVANGEGMGRGQPNADAGEETNGILLKDLDQLAAAL